MKRATQFNTWLAVLLTKSVGTMWCAYIFTILALLGLPSAIDQMHAQGLLPLIQWIAQTFLQLVLLSVIMVGQNVLQQATDERAEADFEINKKGELEVEAVLARLEALDLKILEVEGHILDAVKGK